MVAENVFWPYARFSVVQMGCGWGEGMALAATAMWPNGKYSMLIG